MGAMSDIAVAMFSLADIVLFVSALQDPVCANNGGSTTPTAAAAGKKGKKSRGKDAATDSGNGDAGTAENNERATSAPVVICSPSLCDAFDILNSVYFHIQSLI